MQFWFHPSICDHKILCLENCYLLWLYGSNRTSLQNIHVIHKAQQLQRIKTLAHNPNHELWIQLLDCFSGELASECSIICGQKSLTSPYISTIVRSIFIPTISMEICLQRWQTHHDLQINSVGLSAQFPNLMKLLHYAINSILSTKSVI